MLLLDEQLVSQAGHRRRWRSYPRRAKEPEDYSPEERAAMGEKFFRWRYCSVCKTDSHTTAEVPPYFWVHDVRAGEHHSR